MIHGSMACDPIQQGREQGGPKVAKMASLKVYISSAGINIIKRLVNYGYSKAMSKF